MEDILALLIPIVAIICATIVLVAPIAMFLHYFTRWRTSKVLSADDERLLEDLWRTAQKLEQRIETMETILTREQQDAGETQGGRPWPEGGDWSERRQRPETGQRPERRQRDD